MILSPWAVTWAPTRGLIQRALKKVGPFKFNKKLVGAPGFAPGIAFTPRMHVTLTPCPEKVSFYILCKLKFSFPKEV